MSRAPIVTKTEIRLMQNSVASFVLHLAKRDVRVGRDVKKFALAQTCSLLSHQICILDLLVLPLLLVTRRLVATSIKL